MRCGVRRGMLFLRSVVGKENVESSSFLEGVFFDLGEKVWF